MGLGLPQSVLVSPQLFVVRAMDLPSGVERYYQRFYLNMDREKSDRWLLSLVPGNVELGVGHLPGTEYGAMRPCRSGSRSNGPCRITQPSSIRRSPTSTSGRSPSRITWW